jgi:hypothetical protein
MLCSMFHSHPFLSPFGYWGAEIGWNFGKDPCPTQFSPIRNILPVQLLELKLQRRFGSDYALFYVTQLCCIITGVIIYYDIG